jgi:hypothetical protein
MMKYPWSSSGVNAVGVLMKSSPVARKAAMNKPTIAQRILNNRGMSL